MENMLSSIIGILSSIIGILPQLWRCTKEQASYCMDLEDKINELRSKKDVLQNLYRDVNQRVEQEEQQQLQRTNEVNGWLQRAEALVKAAEDLLEKGDREVSNKCLRTCPKNCVSSYKIGKEAKKKLIELNKSSEEGRCFKVDPVAVRPLHPSPVEIPIDKGVGTETLFEDVWKWLEDESVRVIGIYGMGGVGKTHLLTEIYNHFSHMSRSDRKYDYIFFVMVGKEGDSEKIQRDIWRKLNIPDPDGEWERKDKKERAAWTLSLLRGKKSLLFLDDMWKSIDVHKDIGIPQPEDDKLESKIIFTTRLEQVCAQMRAHKSQKVPMLPSNKARQLFEECVGEETVRVVGNIQEFDEIIRECNGLPLAIKTVGKAMAGKKSHDDWKNAIYELKNSPSKFPHMEDEVFKLLMFSYDCLPNETHRQCFLSCALYPEDYEISRASLVQLWIAEGLLDTDDDDGGDVVRRARDRGNSILNSLVQACMLEAVTDSMNRDVVRMHDLVRDMALWIGRDYGHCKNKILVQPFDPKKWKAAEKISFWDSDEGFTLPIQSSPCPNLCTLILHYARIRSIPNGFFSIMPSLKVLDLSGNLELVMLPDDVGELTGLQSLDLSVTNIRVLPMAMQNLKKLRYLLLPYIHARFLKDLMSNFIDLRLFGWSQDDLDIEDGITTIEALEGMKHLCEVSLTLSNSKCMKKFIACPKLLKCVSSLHITRESFHEFWSLYVSSSSQSSSLSSTLTMDHLELLDFSHYEGEAFPPCGLNQVRWTGKAYCFSSLKKVKIFKCEAVVDLTWLIHNTPKLERLVVRCCSSLREVVKGEIGEEDATKLFASLIYLELNDLPHLNSICRRTLPFPSIRTMMITRCPNLKKLSLSEGVVRTLLTVSGERDWWNALQWDHPSMKQDIEKKVPNIWIF